MLFGVPTMYHRLAEHCEATPDDARRLARARLLVSGSAALPVRENERLFRLFGQRVVERYGLTETVINTAARHDGPRTPGTVGPPLPGVALRLVDDQRRPVAAGPDVLGEVAVRGPNVFAGYLNRPDATAAALDADGWFYTGDIAALTELGEVKIVGRRATDLIKTGGYKVGAGEVEAALLEHPAVREAAVIGVPDDDLGERIVAFVVAAPGAAPSAGELADHVAKLLAPHKRPRSVRLVQALPRNAMGKVLKKQLAGLAGEEAG
jgi:malonyl-CoA/methylmalonyl-CoA synthetase